MTQLIFVITLVLGFEISAQAATSAESLSKAAKSMTLICKSMEHSDNLNPNVTRCNEIQSALSDAASSLATEMSQLKKEIEALKKK